MAKKKKTPKKKINKPKINVKKAAALANEGLDFCRSGDYLRGISLLLKAEERAGKNDKLPLNIAIAYHALRDFSNARKYYARAMRSNPENMIRILQSGINELSMNKIESAECCIGAVFDVDPKNKTAILASGSILLRKGNKEEGAKILRDCYLADPKMSSAIVELAEFSEITQDDINTALGNIDKGIGDRKGDKFLHLAIAKGYDLLGDYKNAFEYYSRANEEFARGAHITNYQAAEDLQGHYNVLSECMTPEFINQYNGISDEGENLVFVVGLPKSGLHEVSFLLQDSSAAVISGEMNWCNEKIFQMLQANDNDFAKTVSLITPEMIKTLADDYKNIVSGLTRTGKLVVNCKASNFVNIWFIRILFPKAKIICSTRCIEDQVLELFFNNTPNMEYLNDILSIGKYCKSYTMIMELWQELFSDSLVTFDYDLFVKDPDVMYRKLMSDIGIDNPSNIKFDEVTKPTLNVNEIYAPVVSLSEKYKDYTSNLDQVLHPESDSLGLNFNNFNTEGDADSATEDFKLNFGASQSNSDGNDNNFKLNF